MKAAIPVHQEDGNRFEIRDVKTPVPGDGEVLVRIHASTVQSTDRDILRGKYKLLEPLVKRRRDVLTGLEFSGTVASDGTIFKPGEEVMGYVNLFGGGRTHAEYATFPEAYLHKKPPRLSHEQAATLPVGGLTSVVALDHIARVKPGQRILVTGGTGGTGSFAIQMAHIRGCKVDALSNRHSRSFLKSLHVNKTISNDDSLALAMTTYYNLILDCVPLWTLSKCKALLRCPGNYINILPQRDIPGILCSLFSRKRSRYLLVTRPEKNVFKEVDSIAANPQFVPLVDSVFTLENINQAIEKLGQRGKRGRIVLDCL